MAMFLWPGQFERDENTTELYSRTLAREHLLLTNISFDGSGKLPKSR